MRRDLHDGLGPTLAATVLGLDASRRAIMVDPERAECLLIQLREQLQEAIADVRRLVYALRPPALDELGLVGALREHARRMSGSPGDLHIAISASEPLTKLPAAVEVAAYRIAMEAINNASRHADASQCSVKLQLNGSLEIEVVDDGRGLPADRPAGVGLQSMRERADELGGVVAFSEHDEGGTVVRVRLPVVTP